MAGERWLGLAGMEGRGDGWLEAALAWGRGEAAAGLEARGRPGEDTRGVVRRGDEGVRREGEALPREEVRAVRWRSSSDFFLPGPAGCFSCELEREFGRVYRLLVDLDLVSPPAPLLVNLR